MEPQHSYRQYLIYRKALWLLGLLSFLLGSSVGNTQVIWVPYTVLIEPRTVPCDTWSYAGETGKLPISPGISARRFIPVNHRCDIGFDPDCASTSVAPLVSVGTLPDCYQLSASLEGYNDPLFTNDIFYGSCDGVASFTLVLGVTKFAGTIEYPSCDNCVPAGTNVITALSYEPPAPNLIGMISLPGPLRWEIVKNPELASIATNGWYGATLKSGKEPGTITVRAFGTNDCFVDRDIPIGCGSGCSTGDCLADKPGFGDGTVGLASIDFNLSLGSALGESAGALRLHVDTPSLNASKPFSLTYYHEPNGVQVWPRDYNPGDWDTWIKEIKTPHGLVTLREITAGYELRFFASNNVGGFIGGTNVHTPDTEFVTWRVENPDGLLASNKLEISRIIGGVWNRWSYQWITNGWALTNFDNSVQTLVATQLNSSASFEARTTYSSNGTLVAFSGQKFETNSTGGPVIHAIRGLGADARTNTSSYYSNGMLQYVIRQNGSWEYYVYDDSLRPINIFSSFGNQTITNNSALCRMVEHSYDTNWVSGSGDAGVYSPSSPRRTIEYVLNQPVSIQYQSFTADESRLTRCLTTNLSAAGNLTTITKFFTSGYFYRKPRSIERPDGTMDFFQYYGVPANTVGYTNIVSSGEPNSGKTDIEDGTKTITITGPLGELISVTTTDIKSTNIVVSKRVYGDYNIHAQPQAITNVLDGTWEYSARFCCGDTVTTNREGTETTKTYDVINRLITATTDGITWSNLYDAAGNMVQRYRFGTSGPPISWERNVYNTAGTLTARTNALLRPTIFGEMLDSSGQRIVTNIVNVNSSLFGQRRETYYRDGGLARIEGSMVHPVAYEYGAFVTNGGGTFVKETKLYTNGTPTSEWVIQFYDMFGRPCRKLFADGGSSYTFYNSKGYLTNIVDPDGVSTLYFYNAKGERALTVLDLNRDGVVDANGTDRITWTTNYVINNGITDVVRTETRVSTNGSATPTLTSVRDAAVNGYNSWSTNLGLVTRTESDPPSGGIRYTRDIAPDGTTTTMRFENGRITATGRTNNTIVLGATTFSYDAHRRQELVTDVRTGTRTNVFDDMDRLIAFFASADWAFFDLDFLGRSLSIAVPSGSTFMKYLDSGEVTKVTGGHNYPVEYTYDYAGRMKTMKTWREYNGGAGTPAVTTWNYSATRGWLDSKDYPDPATGAASTVGPEYTYTSAGRLRTRLWARGVGTTNLYNNAGEIAAVDYSDSTPDVTYSYDRLGRRTTITDGAGTHVFDYDLDGHLLLETNTTGMLTGLAVTQSYDGFYRRSSIGLVSDSSTVTHYGYDEASRMLAVTNGVNTATYSYVANVSLVDQIEFAQSGSPRLTTSKTYDLMNRLTQISNAAYAGGSENTSFAYALNSAGQRTAVTNADGSRWAYQYDSLGQVTSGKKYWSDGTAVLGQQFEYTFDEIGNRKTAVSGGDSNGRNKRTQNYTTDFLNQYSQRTVPGYLDVLGMATNSATVTVNSGTTSRKGDYYRSELTVANSTSPVWQSISNTAVLASGTNDYVTNWSGNIFIPRTPEVFGYDADGNMTNDGRWILTWDAENRLVEMQSLSGAPASSLNRLAFAYDAQGRRIKKVTERFVAGTWNIALSNLFVYDGWNLLAELNATNNATINSFTWGFDLSGEMGGVGGVGGLLSVITTNSGAHFVGFDGNGNVAALVGANTGESIANYQYDPFGNLLRGGGSAVIASMRFSSKYTDDESGFCYYGYRYYNPAVGRWLSKDPIAEKGGNNLYAILGNDCIRNIDVLGQRCVCGDDVSRLIGQTEVDVTKAFRAADKATKDAACSSMFSLDSLSSWDLGWLKGYKLSGSPGKCQNSVVFKGKCVDPDHLNYVLFGWAIRLCEKDPWTTLSALAFALQARGLDDRETAQRKFNAAAFGYWGLPAFDSPYADCKVQGSKEGSADPSKWKWKGLR